MPFASKAQARFMFARHPEIARRWAREYGAPKRLPGKVNPESRSNENNSPTVERQPRLPGIKRDFSMLTPSQSVRHTPKSKPRPNEVEAMAEAGVQFMPGSRHTELGTPQAHKGNRARDVRAAIRGI